MLTFIRCSTWDKRFHAAILAHYTKSKGAPPGKKMAWEILEDGEHRGWIGIGEPAFKLRARKRLGIEDERPLPNTVSCFIFRLDADGQVRASQILKEWHKVASDDWEKAYGWKPEHWETMVQPTAVKSEVPGACFRRAGYRSLGMTTGLSCRRPPGRTHSPRLIVRNQPLKLVLYRGPLERLEKTK
jgi:hypothetical protein